MRRRRQGKWDEEVEGLGPSPEKKHFHKVISLGIFYRSFYRQKTWTRLTVTRSLGTRILRFNCETELTKAVQNYLKTHGQTRGGGRT